MAKSTGQGPAYIGGNNIGVTNWTIDVTAEVVDTTDTDATDNWMTNIAGLKQATGSIDLNVTPTSTIHKSPVSLEPGDADILKLYLGAPANASFYYLASARFGSISTTSPRPGLVVMNIPFTSNGAVTSPTT